MMCAFMEILDNQAGDVGVSWQDYWKLNVVCQAYNINNNNNNNNNNIIYIALYTKVLKRFTMEGGTGIIKTHIT